ncbi:MAG TPA: LCP family protein [Desulfosporosinus sp.]|nr:LCP family protein [Desulfosporosinus sp.]
MKKKQWAALIATLVMVTGGGIYAWRGNLVKQASTSVIANPTIPIEVPEASPKAPSRINVLLLGSDARGDEASRTDTMILISADTKTKHVSMISIPRDTRVNLPGIGLTKITHANAMGELSGGVHEGTMAAVQAASDLLGVTINDYVKINFEGFRKIIDTVGGLDVTLPEAVNDTHQKINLPAGTQHLNSDEALRLARARYGLPDGDFGRQRDQALLLSALGDKLLSLKNIPKLPEILTIIHADLMDTNLNDAQMLALGTEFKGIAQENIKYFQLPGKGIRDHDPLVGTELYYFEADKAGVKKIVIEALAY